MGKMLTALLLVLAIELAMAFFVAPWADGANKTSMMDFLVNLEDWSSTEFLTYLIGDLTLLGGAAIFVGSLFSKQDWIWRAAMIVASFFTFGSVIFRLHTFFMGGLGYIGVEAARTFIATTLVGFLALYFVMVSIDFISGKD